jgi:iron complex transport system substrate-binding protein
MKKHVYEGLQKSGKKMIAAMLASILVVGTLSGCAKTASDTTKETEKVTQQEGGSESNVSDSTGTEDGIVVTDLMGRTVRLSEAAKRIVVLSPSDCEIVYDLGVGDTIVGRSVYCDYPSEVEDLPVLDTGADLNVEQILALTPDLVLMQTMNQTKEQVEALEAAGIAVAVGEATNLEEVYESIEMIGTLTGTTSKAQSIVTEMKETFASLQEEAGSIAKGCSIYFEVSPLEFGLWTAGEGTFFTELAQMFGASNAFSDVNGWAEISQEQVLARNPDVMITTNPYNGVGQTSEEEIRMRTGWQDLKAVQLNQVYYIDPDLISRPGPRLVDAAKTLFEILQGATY